jgi:hypothetical protein
VYEPPVCEPLVEQRGPGLDQALCSH